MMLALIVGTPQALEHHVAIVREPKGGSKLRSGLTRGNGICLIVAGLVAALAVSLAGCGGTDRLTSLKRTLENPFRKEEAKLPGERIAVITDPNMVALDPAEAGRPLQLPSPQANASWSQPGGSPSNSLGHLALGDQLRKVWSADAGTGSSSSGRLSAVPLVADGKVFTLDAGRQGDGFLRGQRRQGLVGQRYARQ